MTARVDELKFRRFLESDLDEVYRLVRETIDTSYAAVYPPRVIEFFHQYHERAVVIADAASGHTIVVHSGGKLVATGTRADTTVRRVFVRDAWQRRGIGQIVMAELEAVALAAGVARLDGLGERHCRAACPQPDRDAFALPQAYGQANTDN